MYPYSIEQLAWAVERDREEEVRQTRSHTGERADVPKGEILRKAS
jgi:hypothetical protein